MPQTAVNITVGDDPAAEKNLSPRPEAAGKVKDMMAVALARRDGDARAPRVTAAGRGHVARQIVEIAFASGVKVREDADLAEILSAIDPETDIPVEAFAAVAEILIYLYHANGMDDFKQLSRDDLLARWMGDDAT